MKDIFAQRLKSLRIKQGLSLERLASLLNHRISKQAINKYEQAKMLPDNEVLKALSKIFQVEESYFFKPTKITLKNINFRENHYLGKREEETLKVKIIEFLEPYLELESVLGIQTEFINPIKDLEIWSHEHVETAATQMRKAWKLGDHPIYNVLEMLESEDIKVLELEDVPISFDALAATANGNIPIILVRQNLEILEKRVAVLRELAFLAMSKNHSCDLKICTYFANAFLLPKNIFFENIGRKRKSISIQELIKIKENFGISIKGIMERAAILGVIPIAVSNRFRRFIKSSANRSLEIGYGRFNGLEKSGRFHQLLYKAIAENIIPLEKAASMARVSSEKLRSELHLL